MFSFSPPRGVTRGKSHEGIVRRGNGCPYGLMHAHPRRTAVAVRRTVVFNLAHVLQRAVKRWIMGSTQANSQRMWRKSTTERTMGRFVR